MFIFEKDKFYIIHFYDHVKDGKDLLVCRISGRVISQTAKKLVVVYWDIVSEDKDDIENNIEQITIHKDTIIDSQIVEILSPHLT